MCGDRYLIFGTGSMAGRQLDALNMIRDKNVSIVAFVDNNQARWGEEFKGYPVIGPHQIKDMDFDFITIWSSFFDDIKKQLVEELHISGDKLKSVFSDFIDICEKQQMQQCRSEEELNDSKVFFEELRKQHTLQFMKFQPVREKRLYEVHFDNEAEMNYVIFEEKRMYLSRNYQEYIMKGDKKYINDIWYEQDENSPHRYEEGEICVRRGDILLDAGVCEGNFTLHHIDKVKKAYLVECDPDWMEALQHTFAPYKEKIVFVPKFLSDEDTEEKIKIDTLIPEGETINFLKMDIEGEEIKALHGGLRTIKSSSDFCCAVCSYHRHGDEDGIRKIMQEAGLRAEASRGYIMFIYDKDFYSAPELRRGVIRGKNIIETLEKRDDA